MEASGSSLFSRFVWIGLLLLGCASLAVHAHRKVKLSDVKTLTLSHGSYTTGRRSSPIPQLQCVGGSAGCTSLPPTVQCYNKGSDGIDIQWECKADLPKSLKFGHIEVACEGYDYPDDPYILQGSCGLEYKLERTGHSYGEDSQSHSYYGQKGKSSSFQNVLFLGVLCFIIYVIYKSCMTNAAQRGADGYTDIPPDDPTSGPSGRRGFFGGGGSPPPPGFRPDYHTDASCGSGAGLGGRGGSGLGGFWSGAAAGGLLGYMFGNRGNTGYASSGFGYPREGTFSSAPSFSSSSSGTYSSSGFGGTRRR
ncbi:store-operated calcium entry-associated regulatory factor isoform X1 [Ixodes scapularis]|uniref:store-operated calcium entry-associated regulatory factor isoform X1 n=1 Tax=Ixodes scapularis TaxID=6945 RepID=UPI001A9D9B8B|nr:store-operated calcium entry-associated regulatory factor isoform X1 [Ixodes scapularis]